MQFPEIQTHTEFRIPANAINILADSKALLNARKVQRNHLKICESFPNFSAGEQ